MSAYRACRGRVPATSSFLVLAIIFVPLLMLLFLSGCGGNTVSTFTYAENSDPTSIDPAVADESVGVNIDRYLFDGLVRYNSATGEVEPAVAQSWEVSSDATAFTFHLRHGVKFSNGREVTAQDFIYSWTRALDPATKSDMAMEILGPIKGAADLNNGNTKILAGVQAVDNYTLKVTLEYPLAEFVTFLGHPVAAPVPKEEVEKAGGNFAKNPVGDGPFKLKAWQPNQSLTLVSNDNYYGKKPGVGQVVVRIIPNAATAIAELKAGNVDAVKTVPSGEIDSLKSDKSVKLYKGRVNATEFIGFNLDMQPWQDNVKLRQALNWAVDRQTIADKVLQGQALPADGIVPVSMPGHQPAAMPYKYDPAKAKSLLADAGYPGGQGLPPIKLSYKTEGNYPDVAQAVQANLKDIGVNVQLEGLDSGVFQDEMPAGKLGLFLISWQADYNSVDTFLYPLFKSDEDLNVFKYNNPEVDKMLEQARSTLDGRQRIEDYNNAERAILADSPLIPLTFRQDVIAYSPRVTNFVYTPLGDLALNEITVSEK